MQFSIICQPALHPHSAGCQPKGHFSIAAESVSTSTWRGSISGMKILIAVDETESAHRATKAAKSLFPDAEHIILSAAELPPFAFGVPLGGIGVSASNSLNSAIEASAESTAKDAAESFPEGAASDTATGDAGLIICREAARLGVDVVVVGRETKSVISRFFHPSVSDYVMKNAPCPVLVVREGEEQS